MQKPTKIVIPPRLDTLSEPKRSSEIIHYLIRLAALHHNRDGNLRMLGRACGFSHNTLFMAASRGHMSPAMAIKLEEVLGREYFPREVFRPDIFVVSGEA